MKKFDTEVQHLKCKVLQEVAKHAWNDTLNENVLNIPEHIISDTKATMRCCVYKERAILTEMVKIAMGGDSSNPNVIEVIDIACDKCPADGYEVTNVCRGCVAHKCKDVCHFESISFDSNHKAHIDKNKCKKCSACARACPYNAIIHHQRPCQSSCKVKEAMSVDENNVAFINNDKCIACGACVHHCPFGAIMDKSFILNAIDIIKKSENNTVYKVYAVVAPSIASQFTYAKLGQVIAGIKKLGFYKVVEAALGADIVAAAESKELAEKGFLTSSCCPAFVSYVKKNFPEYIPDISHNLSPMAAISKYIKSVDKSAKIIFIGPCTAKKAEIQLESVKPYVDVVITFEELQALFDSRNINISTLDETTLDDASYFGRIFAYSGGVSAAVVQGIKEQKLNKNFELKAVACNGIEECRNTLLKKNKNLIDVNFIEGMACQGGCIGGAGCLTHTAKDKNEVEKYGMQAGEKTISEAIKELKQD